ncbi:MAG: hypothetical protein NVSMB24_28170 [Mucilaginibacter sp.]
MSNAISELSKLNFDGKQWISELRNKLCEVGILDDLDIQNAFTNLNSDVIVPPTKSLGAAVVAPSSPKTVYKLYANENVSGLIDNKSITFSPHFSLIYGKNGSGKTSYYKILKDAFHSNQGIIGNIYNPSTALTRAKVDFVNRTKHIQNQIKGKITDFPGTDALTIDWSAGNQNKSNIKFCDDTILSSSLSKKETGWSIDRYKLGYYDQLRVAVENVEEKCSNKIKSLTAIYSENIQILLNGLKGNSESSIKSFLTLNKDTHLVLLKKFGELNELVLAPDHENIKKNLQGEANISVQDLTSKMDLLKIKIIAIDKLLEFLSTKNGLLSEWKIINDRIIKINKLKESLDFTKFEQYQLLFDPLTNQDKYIELLKKIAETALIFGFEKYPDGIEKCFYCNQDLPDENKSLIASIHKIIDNETNQEIDQLQKHLQNHSLKIEKTLINIPVIYTFSELMEIYTILGQQLLDLKILQVKALDDKSLKSINQSIKDLNESLLDVDQEQCILVDLMDTLRSEKHVIQVDLFDANERLMGIEVLKNKAKIKLDNLEDIEFCFHQKALITTLITKINELKTYNKSFGFFQGYKMKISKDKGRVENDLIRTNYIDSFNKNLAYFDLSNRDKIKRPFSNPGGTSKIEVKIEANNKTFAVTSILSEGEAKVYSLCDWLTELEFDDSEILIFDDPITSLDQVNIQLVVAKIIELSKKYQVIVFTHNFEFYHRLIQQSLGGAPINNGKCELCADNPEAEQCIGFVKTTGNTHKCSSYYLIEHILQPGELVEEVMFLSIGWEQRIEIIRQNLLNGDIREADKHLRTTINNFFERFVLNDIKRQVYKNNDLIKEWRDMRDINVADYDALMEVHNKVSGEGTIHESSSEVRTALDVRGYIGEFNKTVRAINSMKSFNNPSPPAPILEIV